MIPRWTITDWTFALIVGGACAVLFTGCAPQRVSSGGSINLRR